MSREGFRGCGEAWLEGIEEKASTASRQSHGEPCEGSAQGGHSRVHPQWLEMQALGLLWMLLMEDESNRFII